MPWARLDDRFPVHPKVRTLSDAAFRLHVSALCWAAENLTDGRVDSGRLRFVSDVRQPAKNTRELVGAGLWHEVPGGWQINDWHEYNPSRDEVLTKRRIDAEKKRRQRIKNLEALEMSLGDSHGDSHGDSLGESPPDSLGDAPEDSPRDSPAPAPAGPSACGPSRPPSFGSLVGKPPLSDARGESQSGGLKPTGQPVAAARRRAAGRHGTPNLEGWDLDSCGNAMRQAAERHEADMDTAYERLLIVAADPDSRSPYRLSEAWDWAGRQADEVRRGEAKQRADAKRNAAIAREHAATAETQAARRRRIAAFAEADPDGWASAQTTAAAELEAEGLQPLAPLVAARALDICERQAAS